MLLYSFGNVIEDLLDENKNILSNAKVACVIDGELKYLENDYFEVSVVDDELKYLEKESDGEKPYFAYFTTSNSDYEPRKYATLDSILTSVRWNCNCCSCKREQSGFDGDCIDNDCAILVSNLNSVDKEYKNENIYYVEDVRYDRELNLVVLELSKEQTY